MPVLRPDYQITVVALNNTALSVSWPPIYRENVHSVFRGYKLLYTETANSSYTEYSPIIIYANYTETLLTGLVQVTNYTVRVLAFGLSGDGLISKPVITSTLDGEGLYIKFFLSRSTIYTGCTTPPPQKKKNNNKKNTLYCNRRDCSENTDKFITKLFMNFPHRNEM